MVAYVMKCPWCGVYFQYSSRVPKIDEKKGEMNFTFKFGALLAGVLATNVTHAQSKQIVSAYLRSMECLTFQ